MTVCVGTRVAKVGGEEAGGDNPLGLGAQEVRPGDGSAPRPDAAAVWGGWPIFRRWPYCGIWEQQYIRDRRRRVRQRTEKELPPGAARIASPYDPDARVGIKRSTRWDGYKLHLTETCDADGANPHLITHTPASSNTLSMSILRLRDVASEPPCFKP